ncbi:MAG: sigma-54-dependent Fis family transcriptional regulator [Desulfuromonadales bacterium]|nr:sigma-54-dependent Fis family transcriptional regulator [Desulfuromonadales bacterium]
MPRKKTSSTSMTSSDHNSVPNDTTESATSSTLPRILVIDDMFGRQVQGRPNRERANLCGMYGLRDVTGDEPFPSDEEVVNPTAEAVFFRGQQPLCATVGDSVENDLGATIAFVRKGWHTDANSGPTWALVLLDLCFYTGAVTPDSNNAFAGMPVGRAGDDDARSYFGLTILKRLREEFPELPVVILSSKQREEVSLLFTEAGALGFISRTDSAGRSLLGEYLWRHGLTPDPSGTVVGTSLRLLLALRKARREAEGRQNVLIRGERGTGKDLLAQYLNRYGTLDNERRPFVTVDCGALLPSIWKSELLGHKRGAYTGADSDRQGLVVQANGGDLFLDEIGNMIPEAQEGLLRVIETREVVSVGATSGRVVDVRFIAATNKSIEKAAEAGTEFLPDLLDRLNFTKTIWLPPLRERRSDIPLLVERFVREAESSCEVAMNRQIRPNAMNALLAYDWPGNIRQLQSVVRDAVNSHRDVEYLVAGHLHFGIDIPAEAENNAADVIPPIISPAVDLPPATEPVAEQPERPLSTDPKNLNGSFDRLVAGFHEQIADVVEACLSAYSDPLTGKVNYTGAYRLAVSPSEQSSNVSGDAKRWFRMLFVGKNGLVAPLPAETVAKRPLLMDARRWACGSGS